MSQDFHVGIRADARPDCYLCGGVGESLYKGLVDRRYGVPGEWGMSRCRRPECGLIWLDPMPVKDDIHKAYAKFYTHADAGSVKISSLKHFFNTVQLEYLRVKYGSTVSGGLRRLLAPLALLHLGGRCEVEGRAMFLPRLAPASRVLDVGCGSGSLVESLRDLGWDAEGIDTDPKAIEAGRSRGLPVRVGGIEEMGYSAGSFDAITSNHVVEHVHDPLALLQECCRLLKPGGTLIMATPNSGGWGHQRFSRHWYALDPPRHVFLFNRRNFARMFELAGFSEIRVTTNTRAARTILSVSRMFERGEDLGAGYGTKWRAAGVAYQFRERWSHTFSGQQGEEILCVARKV